jgi:predicted DNA-binding WGR domain protein
LKIGTQAELVLTFAKTEAVKKPPGKLIDRKRKRGKLWA